MWETWEKGRGGPLATGLAKVVYVNLEGGFFLQTILFTFIGNALPLSLVILSISSLLGKHKGLDQTSLSASEKGSRSPLRPAKLLCWESWDLHVEKACGIGSVLGRRLG